MKKIILIFWGTLIAYQCIYAQKYVMVVTQKDGRVAKYDVNSVEKLVWEKHEAVDLGLSVKWATCNIGANAPEELGDYFAWGETAPKDYYYWNKYRWAYQDDAYYKLNKYFNSYGYGDNKTVLELEDDVVHIRWGSKWRMPTNIEQEELRQCTWTLTEQNGVKGVKVTGPSGNHIFFPYGGFRRNNEHYGVNILGRYWSASLYANEYAYIMAFDQEKYGFGYDLRYLGLLIRPVWSD